MEFTKKKNLIDSFFLWCSVLVWQWHSYRVNHQAGTCCSTDPTLLTYNDRLPVFAYGPSRKKNFSRTHTHTHTHNRNVNSIIYLKKPFKKRTTKSILFENTPYYLLMKAPIRTALHDYQRHLITYKELFDIRLKRECFFFFFNSNFVFPTLQKRTQWADFLLLFFFRLNFELLKSERYPVELFYYINLLEYFVGEELHECTPADLQQVVWQSGWNAHAYRRRPMHPPQWSQHVTALISNIFICQGDFVNVHCFEIQGELYSLFELTLLI